jgi:hypothetical protein
MGLSDKLNEVNNMRDKTSLDEKGIDEVKKMQQRKKANQDDVGESQ